MLITSFFRWNSHFMEKKPFLYITVHMQELYILWNGCCLLPILNSVVKTCLFSDILENLLKAHVYPLSWESFEKTSKFSTNLQKDFKSFYKYFGCPCVDWRRLATWFLIFCINIESSWLHLDLTRISSTAVNKLSAYLPSVYFISDEAAPAMPVRVLFQL